jgi:hypothetical protein
VSFEEKRFEGENDGDLFDRPTLESDPNCNEKKKYIGNDYATIVYNESGEDYNLNTIKVRCGGGLRGFRGFNFSIDSGSIQLRLHRGPTA